MKHNTYILHWLDGSTETITGFTIADAFNKAGMGQGTLSLLDWWEKVEDK